ncbi:MAG: hypothetical protein U0223_06780 [Nitrospira sp.]|nr:hypothetical protein [Nitrospira sp.]
MARDAISAELAVKAESLSGDSPVQSGLLALTAWKISPIDKTQALIRAAIGGHSTQTVLRGHEGVVWSAQFGADGKHG